jgi:predicted secreted hydrolase
VALTRPDPAVRSAWPAHTVYFAHLAVTDVAGQTFTYREKAQRGALGLAGAAPDRLQVWVDDWRAEAQGESHRLLAAADGLGLDFTLTPSKPPVFHGEGGFSRKAAGTDHASQYYSISRLTTQGTLTLNGREFKVQGESWLDREFSTSQLAPHQAGWDWFALHLDDGSDLMLYQLRLQEGGLDSASAGTYIDPQGLALPLHHADFTIKATAHWRSPHTGARYPAAWEISVPSQALTLTLTPTLPDQELQTKASTQVTYWEGQVALRGVKNAIPVTGLGYAELTGYAGPLGGRF